MRGTPWRHALRAAPDPVRARDGSETRLSPTTRSPDRPQSGESRTPTKGRRAPGKRRDLVRLHCSGAELLRRATLDSRRIQAGNPECIPHTPSDPCYIADGVATSLAPAAGSTPRRLALQPRPQGRTGGRVRDRASL